MKVISGGQTGADQGGLRAAKANKIETGGWAPKGFITKIGCQTSLLKMYGLVDSGKDYKTRTWMNVEDSNVTIRLAVDFKSPGERCTMNAINYYKRPWIDIDLLKPRPKIEVFEFLILVQPSIINIAGNTEHTMGYNIEQMTYEYLFNVFEDYKSRYVKE
jgi:hypothetical protein